ncbi:hypothetical protein ABID26_006566 [Mesorhizobium shonense]|uniref:Uncharacterized protein n=1 Tax=Mesorhizobium shonense TaxID=1209948 RepID=A0ABV2I499_9HYPH
MGQISDFGPTKTNKLNALVAVLWAPPKRLIPRIAVINGRNSNSHDFLSSYQDVIWRQRAYSQACRPDTAVSASAGASSLA